MKPLYGMKVLAMLTLMAVGITIAFNCSPAAGVIAVVASLGIAVLDVQV